jgi:NAD(P)-dependent dehydrogenase (short-subunit alcohol dehydrogenase family)
VKQLQGKTVFITGGARRLGRAMALAAAKNGANVAFTYLNSEDDAQRTLDDINGPNPENPGVSGLAVKCDVRSETSIEKAVASVLKKFGGIDVLINSAGVFETAAFEDITVEQWDNVFATNVRGPFLLSQHCLPPLKKATGRIIHLGSLGGIKPWTTHAHYCSSKAALHMLTQVMAKALAPEIAVNCVAPGMIASEEGKRDSSLLKRTAERTPMRRNGTPADVVSAVMYFASAPQFITGQILTVDGGLGLD